ncbi:MAG: polyphosphate polymerase domain-containing protein [Clostridiales bacterium]|nr:polyphosphate polymerase domain-containing protein [Clostridiales bacterium]
MEEGRCEYKYLLRGAVIDELRRRISEYIPPDKYGDGKPYIVSSIYFDDPAYRLYYQTHDREPYRYKLRLRAYGEIKDDSSISFFEIKSKHLGRSVKKRLLLPLLDNEQLWKHGIIPDDLKPNDIRTARDILYLIDHDNLKPSAVVSYDRLAFAAPGESRLRITFDSALRIRKDNLDMRLGTNGEAIMPEDCCVLELKSGNNLPVWLTRIVSEYGLANHSYSKYGQLPLNTSENKKTIITKQGELPWVTLSAEC